MKGIMFEPGMVRVITGGRKTETRRLIQFHKPFESHNSWEVIYPDGKDGWIAWDKDRPGLAEFTKKAYPQGGGLKPRYRVGEIVYLKEGIHQFNQQYASYDGDLTPVMFHLSANRFHWRWLGDKLSPRSLPEEAARYFLEITAVRPERLQEITLESCWNEGIRGELAYRVDTFKTLWDSVNPKYPFSGNWWCFVYTFRLA